MVRKETDMIEFGHPDVADDLAKTLKFASENETRFDSFVAGLNYVRLYATEEGRLSSHVRAIMWTDRSVGEHGFVFNIYKDRYNRDTGDMSNEKIITLGMVYHKHNDTWGFHS